MNTGDPASSGRNARPPTASYKCGSAVVGFALGLCAFALLFTVGPIGGGPMGLAAILFGVVGFGSRRRVFAILGMVLGAVCLGIFLLAWSTASQLAKTL